MTPKWLSFFFPTSLTKPKPQSIVQYEKNVTAQMRKLLHISHVLVNREIPFLFQARVTISNSKGIPWSGLLLPSPLDRRLFYFLLEMELTFSAVRFQTVTVWPIFIKLETMPLPIRPRPRNPILRGEEDSESWSRRREQLWFFFFPPPFEPHKIKIRRNGGESNK